MQRFKDLYILWTPATPKLSGEFKQLAMGAHNSKESFGATDPKTIQVPFGHVPYSPSLPGAMSQQIAFPIEWGFFAGWAKDASGTEYSIILLSLRESIAGGILYGVGVKPAGGGDVTYQSETHTLGVIIAPEATIDSWSTKIQTTGWKTATLECKLTPDSGNLGLAGSKYEVDFTQYGSKKLNVNLKLESKIGLALQGSAGAFPDINMMQYGMPALSLLSGSSITIQGQQTQLTEGTMWYGRQCLKLFNPIKPVYLGTWFAVMMNDGTSYTLTFYWPPRDDKGTQWIVGTDVDFPPIDQTAVEYPAITQQSGSSPIQGTNILENTEYNCNILNPSDPANSPHWSNKETDGNTYCSAWNLTLKGKKYIVTALVPQAEVNLVTNFYDGAANIYEIDGCIENLVGHAFIEQMGFN